MASTSDFGAFEPQGPPPALPTSMAYVPAELGDKAPRASDLYAAAWSIAHRDHELDKLFNVDFYESR